MSQQRKVISSKQLGTYKQWELPVVGTPKAGEMGDMKPGSRPLTASQLEAVYRQAREEGLAEGRKSGRQRGYLEGLTSGKAEMQARIEQLETLMACFTAPLENLDAQVEGSLVSLAMSVARHLVRRELKLDPGQVVAVVRAAMRVIPVASPRVELHLHPEDASLVRELLAVSDSESKWQIVEEPMLTRGGCKVVTATSQIDATVENRVAAVVVKILGEERESEQLS